MASPVCTPGGQCSVRKPHNSTIPADAVLRFDTQILSLPSTETAHGPEMPLPVIGEKDAWLPSGWNTVMLPPSGPAFWAAMVSTMTVVALCAASGSWSKFTLNAATISKNFRRPCSEFPSLFVTQTFPKLSTASPVPEKPALKVSILPGSEAGNLTTESLTILVIQMRSCWSIAKANGAISLHWFFRGLLVSFLQKIFALLGSPLGRYTNCDLIASTAQMSPLGVDMTPCILLS